jgi:hypothetical protein
MRFNQPFERNVSARSIVESDVPGGLGIFFSRLGGNNPILLVRAGGKELETSLETNQTFYVEPDQSIEFEVVVENRGAVDNTNVDFCGDPDQPDGSGSILDNSGVDTRIVTNGFADDVTKCLAADPAGKTQYVVTLTGSVPDVETGRVVFNSFWAEGANSGVRVTPKYSVQFSVHEDVDGIATEVPTEGTGNRSEDGSELPDYGGFSLADVDAECSISPVDGEAEADVTVDLEGFLSPRAPEGSREILIDLLLNGETVTTGTGYFTVNGSTGETFELRGLDPGEYQVDYDLHDNGWA